MGRQAGGGHQLGASVQPGMQAGAVCRSARLTRVHNAPAFILLLRLWARSLACLSAEQLSSSCGPAVGQLEASSAEASPAPPRCTHLQPVGHRAQHAGAEEVEDDHLRKARHEQRRKGHQAPEAGTPPPAWGRVRARHAQAVSRQKKQQGCWPVLCNLWCVLRAMMRVLRVTRWPSSKASRMRGKLAAAPESTHQGPHRCRAAQPVWTPPPHP